MMNAKGSKKICSMEGCTGPLYARGWCRFHYGTEYLLKKNAEKLPKSHVIPRRTKKRAAQERKYQISRKAFIEAERDQHPRRKIFCIFTDKEIKGEPDIHHAMGRDDEMILDESFWFLCDNYAHVHEYHSKSCKDIPWWNNYMFRMKNINPKVYEKDLLRQYKANLK